MPIDSSISSSELAGVNGGTTVSGAFGNAVDNFHEWRRVVGGRQGELNNIPKMPNRTLPQYEDDLRKYDVNGGAGYKPMIPNENKW